MPDDSHQEWLGYVQPVGVVVSIPALNKAGAAINRNFVPLHRTFLQLLPTDREGHPLPDLRSFRDLATTVLGWQPADLQEPPDSYTLAVAGYDDVLSPTFIVRDCDTTILLIEETAAKDFDAELLTDNRHWKASPQLRFERLLRETGVPAGLLVNSSAIRLVYAPKGESSGFITFAIADMVEVAGRPILAALHMLLSAERLFTGLPDQRLPAILHASRKHQNEVSTKLSRQVMEALFDLLRGFQSAHDQTNGALLALVLRDDPSQVYRAFLTVLLRLVFLLYAEDRDLLSSQPLYANHYGVNGLFESLRSDQGRFTDTMDSRYGSWARLLSLFRIVFGGAHHAGLNIPTRKGYLFDPDRFPFLEGRPDKNAGKSAIPRISDGVLYRVLSKLLVLDGERLSYRSLDVEQIGSVYEAMMGFELHVAAGRSIAIKAQKKGGAPVTINLEELLEQQGAKRNEWLGKTADQKVTGAAERELKAAETIDDLVAALDKKIAKSVTPDVVPRHSMVFQPSPERRRSGSHYTPRSLTAPIVESTLAPVLKNLGDNPKPDQILSLKVCDPAMGSGAFLVEACRQLGDALVQSWHTHNAMPVLPPDEDELLHARRMVAQRCLYGVDKNEMAVDLAKLSLWLSTLARDHQFTFLNHSLRHGDSLLGLSARQIAAFHWEPGPQSLFEGLVRERIVKATGFRREILEARDEVNYEALSYSLARADDQLEYPRIYGDLVLSAFFAESNKARRNNELQRLIVMRATGEEGEFKRITEEMRLGDKLLVPFHWDIEFPEVFQLDPNLHVRGGFDAVVGNPPFLGGRHISSEFGQKYAEWLLYAQEGSHGNADLVAHFFRRSLHLLRQGGCFGLIATNTIMQGDTRSTGLRWICMHGGTIYRARKRRAWPGEAAVVVSVLNVSKGPIAGPYLLDGRPVERITAYLFHAGGHEDPGKLRENENKSFQGSIVLGMGFTFDDTDRKGVASSLAEMDRLIKKDPRNGERIFPYLGGEEVNNHPTHAHHRYVINFEDFSLERAAEWPDLLRIVQERVKPDRDIQNRDALRTRWWQYADKRPGLVRAISTKARVLVTNAQASPYLCIAFSPPQLVFANSLNVFPLEGFHDFAVLQCRVHEVWAWFFSSSLEDRLRYNPSDCFETFPFPADHENNTRLENTGAAYYEFRASLMVRNNEGLTKTYNRFHDPNELFGDIQRLRQLHSAMDRTVLDAYGWSDLLPMCEFFSEFEDDGETDELESSRTSIRKYRYRWPEEIHNEVLARLLALNQARAAAPQISTAAKPSKKSALNPVQPLLL